MTTVFAPGGYRFIPAVFQYSGGVAAEPGFRLVRVRFKAPVPLAEGFKAAEAIITGAGRPLRAVRAGGGDHAAAAPPLVAGSSRPQMSPKSIESSSPTTRPSTRTSQSSLT